LLVLALLTLVVSAVVPNFSKFSIGRQGKYTSTQFLALTRYARSSAISEGRTHRINFEDKAFWVTVDDGSGTFVQLGNEYGKRHELPSNVTMTVIVDAKENVATVGTDRPLSNSNDSQLGSQVLDFTPDGMGDTGRVVFTSANGEATTVVSETPSDLFRIVDANATLVQGGRR
jgi:Tfp pilus assembly protein FimT